MASPTDVDIIQYELGSNEGNVEVQTWTQINHDLWPGLFDSDEAETEEE